MSKRLSVELPTELFKRLDEVIEYLDFSGEEELIEAAVRRLLDKYTILMREVVQDR